MKILLTGATGYIGQRLLFCLLQNGHEVVCCVRDRQRFDTTRYNTSKIEVVEVDFLKEETLENIPKDIEATYYLIHSMTESTGNFEALEANSAYNFKNYIQQTSARQVIYLSGIVNERKLSKHLNSRKRVEEILSSGSFHLTTLRAGIIVGEGSASFEIIRDLVEKLPVMIAPRWLETRSQPIAVTNVIEYLQGVLMNDKTFDQSYDIGGPEILTYKEMLLKFAKVRKLRRLIITVPVMTPKLSSYWLYFVTSTSYRLAVNLVNSMKVEVIARTNNLQQMLGIKLLSYEEAVRLAFEQITHHNVLSSWTDTPTGRLQHEKIAELVELPSYGCYKDIRTIAIQNEERVLEKIWSIGGQQGWYYANWLWEIRGFIDKLSGGVGLRRGRKSPNQIAPGDSLDFWRVIYANRNEKRLLLYAEMKLPGEAWLEFRIKDMMLYQKATFRPHGLWGRIYWYLVMPFHGIIFNGMIKKLAH